ncbi:hypothetical protein QAD02_000487 [Eretmocerus hayati]|uniref:Uncharacterized protein n=1 Tax=Eretmocerus hayati TaxID=131215 RepID=A0ACC2NEL5_9HYME|nr:hypothetical protein QAD02_000487 [Eretmocerus hayati]
MMECTLMAKKRLKEYCETKYSQPALVLLKSPAKNDNLADVHYLTKNLNKMGLGVNNDLELVNTSISKTLFVLQRDNGSRLWSVTRASSEKIIVNGRMVEQLENRILKYGDTIEMIPFDRHRYQLQLIKIDPHSDGTTRLQDKDADIRRILKDESQFIEEHRIQREQIDRAMYSMYEEYNEHSRRIGILDQKLTALFQDIVDNKTEQCHIHLKLYNMRKMNSEIRHDYENLLNDLVGHIHSHDMTEILHDALLEDEQWKMLKDSLEEEKITMEKELQNMDLPGQHIKNDEKEYFVGDAWLQESAQIKNDPGNDSV